MRLTTKRRYALNAVLDLALQPRGCAVSLKEISDRQKIPLAYLEKLFRKLRQSEVVKSVRGAAGGYLLTKNASELTVADVVAAVEEHELDRNHCSGFCNCNEHMPCLTANLWKELNRTVYDFLNGITLEELIRKIRHEKQ